jgi:hypothetical protein
VVIQRAMRTVCFPSQDHFIEYLAHQSSGGNCRPTGKAAYSALQ